MDLQIQGPSPWEGGRSLQLQPSRWEDLRPRPPPTMAAPCFLPFCLSLYSVCRVTPFKDVTKIAVGHDTPGRSDMHFPNLLWVPSQLLCSHFSQSEWVWKRRRSWHRPAEPSPLRGRVLSSFWARPGTGVGSPSAFG